MFNFSNKKRISYLFFVLAAFLLPLILSGCGLIFPKVTESTYYRIPNWTPDGQIIAMKHWMRFEDRILGQNVQTAAGYSVVVMNEDGTNEHELFGVRRYIQYVTVSPQKSYIGLFDNQNVFWIYDFSGNLVKEMQMDKAYTNIEFNEGEDKIAFSSDYATYKIYSINGILLYESLNGGSPTWGG